MQSVIDSLALDYLHISLSHITGESNPVNPVHYTLAHAHTAYLFLPVKYLSLDSEGFSPGGGKREIKHSVLVRGEHRSFCAAKCLERTVTNLLYSCRANLAAGSPPPPPSLVVGPGCVCLPLFSLFLSLGENVARGDQESVRNLLEIFDGLLEYLTEQLSDDEELQNGGNR